MLKLIYVLTIGMISIFSNPAKASDAVKWSDADYLHGVQKISDMFYVGKIKDRDLWIVIEKVVDDFWKHYARAQTEPKLIGTLSTIMKHSVGGGSGHFARVLSEIDYHKNEVWVAYVTSEPNPKSPLSTKSSVDENFHFALHENEAQNSIKQIKMFVTVTSSPTALLTSHLGINHTAEHIYYNHQKHYKTHANPKEMMERGISMDLHSFAAKVMLMRNPQRRYMVNAPLPDMEMIIANSLPPKSVFIGMRNDKIVYDQFYFLKNVFSKQFNPEPFESFLDKRPPIISRSFSSGKYFMSFFEPKTDEKWLEIDKIKDDQTYNWIFQSAFSPAGEAKHFIAVDLKALAECKPLDSDLSLDNFSKEVSTMKDPEK